MSVLGPTDDRVSIQDQFASTRPFSAIVSVKSTFPDGTRTAGSGAMIGPDDVLTAAHCVYSSDYGGWADTVSVRPALTPSGTPFGWSFAENLITTTGWIDYDRWNLSYALNYDYAYIDLDTNVGFDTGWFDIASGGAVGDTVETLGYPGDHGSSQMVYASGTIDRISGNVFTFYDDLDATPGQSGSPVTYTDPFTGDIDIVGVVSHERYWPVDENGVLRLTSDMVNQIDGWAENSINNPVAADLSFDEAWYLANYPDVAQAVSAGWLRSGEQHFNTYGWMECRDPCEGFNSHFYLLSHPDVREAGVNPFHHYLRWGKAAGWEPDFDPAYYLSANPDVAANGINPTWHYILYGKDEGRSPVPPSSGYDTSEYLISNVADFTSVEILGVQTDIPADIVI